MILLLILVAGGIAVMFFLFSLKSGLFHEHITPVADDPGDGDQAGLVGMAANQAKESIESNDDDSLRDVA